MLQVVVLVIVEHSVCSLFFLSFDNFRNLLEDVLGCVGVGCERIFLRTMHESKRRCALVAFVDERTLGSAWFLQYLNVI